MILPNHLCPLLEENCICSIWRCLQINMYIQISAVIERKKKSHTFPFKHCPAQLQDTTLKSAQLGDACILTKNCCSWKEEFSYIHVQFQLFWLSGSTADFQMIPPISAFGEWSSIWTNLNPLYKKKKKMIWAIWSMKNIFLHLPFWSLVLIFWRLHQLLHRNDLF